MSRAEILERKRQADIANGKRLASLLGAAGYCGVSTKTIRRRISDGTITGYRFGDRVIRVDLNEIDEKLLHKIPTAGRGERL